MAADSLGQLTVDLIANTGGFEAGMDRVQRSLKASTKEAAYQATQLDKLVGQIDPVVGAYGRLDKMEEQLRAHRKAGRLDTSDFNDYLKKLNEQRDSLGLTDKALGKNAQQFAANGQTLRQYQNNLRGIPAQFTDIVTSLQGGQKPLTVFLQQGGQLRDMFGGAGAAAKALGGYVVGLINPLTVGAAAVAAIGTAYYLGSSEATAYNTALINTGNFAGTSADSLGAMANRVSDVTGTVSKASEVLAALAGTGKIAVGSFDMIAVAALKTQSATGRAATDIVADFVKIAEEPVKASLKLNEQMNYLTESVYSQIAALEKSGNQQAAATLAEQEYAKALTTRADKIVEDLGYVESAWRIVMSVAKGAWDAMADVGRSTPLEDQIKKAQTLVDTLAAAKKNALPGTPSNAIREEQAQKDLTDLLVLYEEKKRRESSMRVAAQQTKDLTDAAVRVDKVHEDFASNDLKRAAERAKYEKDIATLRTGVKTGKVSADDPRLNADRIAKDLDDIDAKYADKKAARAKAYVEDAGTKELDQAKQQYAVLQQQSQQLDEQTGKLKALGPAQQELIKWEQELADIKEKKTLTAAQKSLLADADAITNQKTLNAELEKGTESRKIAAEQAKQLAEFTQAQADALSRLQQGLNNQVVGIGLGAEGRKRLQDDLTLQNDYANQVERLRRDKLSGKITQDTYDKEVAILQGTLDKELQAYKDNYAKIDAARAQWQNGMTAALQDYSYEAADIAGQTYGLVTDGLHGIEDTFAQLATEGKLSFKSLTDSIIADLARMAAKAYVVLPLLAALGIGGDAAKGVGSAGGVLSSLTGGSGGGIASMLGTAKNVISAASSQFGKSVLAGWSSGDGVLGGIEGAFTNGADYIHSAITSAFSAGSTTAAEITTESVSQSLTSALSTSTENFAAQFGTGVAEGSYTAAAQSAQTSLLADSLKDLGNIASVLGTAYNVYSGFKQNGVAGGLTTTAFAAAGAFLGGPAGAAIGSTIGNFIGSKLFGSGEKYPDLSTSASGTYSGGIYTGNGAVQNWQTKAPKYGDSVDAQMNVTVSKFTKTLGDLYTAFGSSAQVYAYDLMQVRKTSGKYSATFGATIDGGGANDLNIHQQFDAADAAAALAANYDDVMGTFLAKAIVSSKSLPDYFKAQFTDFSNSWDTTADEVIKAIEGVFTRFNGVNDALSLINVNNVKLDDSGLMASDSILNMVASIEKLDTTTASAQDKVDALNKVVGGFYSAFHTADEQFADLTTSLQKAFAGFGLQLPDTRSAYRQMVEDIDITTAAGQAMFATMMGLATNADSYYSTLDQKAKDAMDAAAAAVQAVTDGLMKGANDAFNALQRAINAQKTSINDMLATANTNVSDLTGVSNDLSSALKTLQGNSDTATAMLRGQAQATLQSALATVKAGGSLANFSGLSDALDAVSSNNTDLYASLEDFNRDQGRSAAMIDELNRLNGKQLTSAEKTVKALQDQLDRLDDQLAFAQAQLDALNGVDNSILGVTDAVNAMNSAVMAALGTLKSATPTNSSTLIDSVYQDVLGRSADKDGKAYWQNELSDGSLGFDQLATAIKNAAAQDAIKSAYSSLLNRNADADGAKYWADQVESGALTVAQLPEAIKNAAKANGSIQAFAKGTNNWDGMPALVGEFGPEIVTANNIGSSTIYPAQRSRALLNGGTDDDQAKRDTDNFRDKVIKKMNEIGRNTGWLDAWNNDGLPAVRS